MEVSFMRFRENESFPRGRMRGQIARDIVAAQSNFRSRQSESD